MLPQFLRKRRLFTGLLTLLLLAGSFHQTLAQDEGDIALLDRSSKAFASVVKKAGPAVVYVGVEKTVHGQRFSPHPFFNEPFFERFFGPQFRLPQQPRQRERRQQGAGSGFIVAKNGYILTNNHVVEDAEKITVRLSDKREFKAKVIGTDPQSDVALIKIDANNLPTLPLGNSDKLEVGEWVIAIGSPFELSQTVTVGVVSAKGRDQVGINDYENFIQTDAAINPGNSGGPLLNIHGEAVGINTAIFSRSGGYMGIGFAIPINMAKSIKNQLLKKGKVTRGWLGVIIQDVDEELAQSFNLENAEGILISEVTPDSPAKKAGIEQGDVLLSMDGVPLKGVTDLRNRVAMVPPGSKVEFEVVHDGRSRNITVSIGEQPKNIGRLTGGTSSDDSLSEMGLHLQPLTPEIADQLGYEEDQGLLIADVEPDSPADRADLTEGQLIEEVNKVRVRTLNDLKKALKKGHSAQRVLLRVRTGEYSRYVVLSTE
ncbi:MAG: serine protease [Desulfobulbus propionicus]|nr:MAG: serine protease [Desulfobulbus propionicus]